MVRQSWIALEKLKEKKVDIGNAALGHWIDFIVSRLRSIGNPQIRPLPAMFVRKLDNWLQSYITASLFLLPRLAEAEQV